MIIIAIDLKSYYASVEANDRGLDPLTTNLVVADESRTEKTICLAVSPSLKAYGIPGRARLFEVVQKVKEVNADRLQKAIRLGLAVTDPKTGKKRLASSSVDSEALAADPSLAVAYIAAPPRMKLYEEISTKIFRIYLKYVSKEDIHVYSIDEVFIDVTSYLNTYHMTAHELAITMIREVLYTTGITATAGIGTNMYLAKVAMDIVAKHVEADADGVRIAELNEMSYREKLWCHRPLRDFWRVGRGISRRIEELGCYTMGDIARLSIHNEDVFYSALGINAELLIDHAWGWEPTEIKTIKSYKPETNSLSSGQVLAEPYDFDHGKLIVREMTELLVLDLVRKGLVTKKLELTISYDRTSLQRENSKGRTTWVVAKTGKRYKGAVTTDYYGRPAPKHAHGTGNIDRWTNAARRIQIVMMDLYDRIVDPDLLIRRVNVVAVDLISEEDIPPAEPEQLSFFVDYAALEQKREEETAADAKEKKMQIATLELQRKFGKNAILKGMNLQEGATTILRNQQIGGHRAGDEGEDNRVQVPKMKNAGKSEGYRSINNKQVQTNERIELTGNHHVGNETTGNHHAGDETTGNHHAGDETTNKHRADNENSHILKKINNGILSRNEASKVHTAQRDDIIYGHGVDDENSHALIKKMERRKENGENREKENREKENNYECESNETTKVPSGYKLDARAIYADIIDLPHHQSVTHPHMSLYDRSAQFAPFAALAGYDDMITEEGRITDAKRDQQEELINRKLRIVADSIRMDHHPLLSFTVFIPDERKEGGSYAEIEGHVKKIDPYTQTVILSSGATIPMKHIHDIHGEILNHLDEEVY